MKKIHYLSILLLIIIQPLSSKTKSELLFDAISNESLKEVKHAIIKLKADINQPRHGMTPLMITVFYNEKDIARFLINRNAQINKRGFSHNHTALSIAVEKNYYDMAKILIRAGADINLKYSIVIKKEIIKTPSYVKCYKEGKKVPCSEGTVSTGMVVTDATVLMIASANGYIPLMKLLLKHKARINDYDVEGTNSLHHALLEEQYEAASVLISNGANVNFQGVRFFV